MCALFADRMPPSCSLLPAAIAAAEPAPGTLALRRRAHIRLLLRPLESLGMTPRPHNGAMDTRASSPTFVGRRTELGRFETALAAARAGHPGVMVIAGEAGVGKTRLVAELAASARASEARVLEGGCVPVGTEGLPFEPLIEALRGLSRELPEAALDELMGPGRAELARLMPQLVRDHGPGDPRLTDSSVQGRLFEQLLPLPGPACRPGSRRPRHRGCPLGRSIQS